MRVVQKSCQTRRFTGKFFLLAAGLCLSPPCEGDTGQRLAAYRPTHLSPYQASWQDYGCSTPLYCEEFTGLMAYADAAETFSDNAICDQANAPYVCGPAWPILIYTLFTY